MPRNNRCFINGTCVDVCFRAQRGLPLSAAPYVHTILLGILGRAQALFPVGIVSVVVMSNHIHMILRVLDPADVPRFCLYVKRELSHAINRWLGRSQVVNWEIGYDAPVIGSAAALMNRLVYHYTNPQRAGLVDSIDEYPNFSTWKYATGGHSEQTVLSALKIARHDIPPLYRRDMSVSQQEHYDASLRRGPSLPVTLNIAPQCWMDCFPETRGQDPQQFADEIISRVRARESELRAARTKPCIGIKKLRKQHVDSSFVPKKRGRRTIILDTCRKRRAVYIAQFKSWQDTARLVRRAVGFGEAPHLPPGFLLAGGVSLASLLLWATPLHSAFSP